jgi:hypothetical protein
VQLVAAQLPWEHQARSPTGKWQIFFLQEEIAREISEKLRLQLTEERIEAPDEARHRVQGGLSSRIRRVA